MAVIIDLYNSLILTTCQSSEKPGERVIPQKSLITTNFQDCVGFVKPEMLIQI
jgi:hypothetical protein